MLKQFLSGDDKDYDKDVAKQSKSAPKPIKTPTLDLHSYNELSQQLEVTEAYISAAIMKGYKSIIIIHGKGEGILRSNIIKLLEQHKHVAKFKAIKDSKLQSGGLRVKFK